MLGAGEAGDRERVIGEALPAEVLDDEVDDDVVLGPEPQVVEAPVGQRVVVPVAVVDDALVDGLDDVGREPRAVGVSPWPSASTQCRYISRESRVSRHSSIWVKMSSNDSTVMFSMAHSKSGSREARARCAATPTGLPTFGVVVANSRYSVALAWYTASSIRPGLPGAASTVAAVGAVASVVVVTTAVRWVRRRCTRRALGPGPAVVSRGPAAFVAAGDDSGGENTRGSFKN